jgi:bifunctional DNA-binding transcriptional regulator/antitoxin component of YhaV-PrlF toxin-antitoxin module
MILTKLKAKNQITIPKKIVSRFNFGKDELFQVEAEENYIKLIPVDVEPRYSSAELEIIDKIAEKGKSRAKTLKAGKEFAKYIATLTE